MLDNSMLGNGGLFNQGSAQHSQSMSEINTTPLVDVMLVLLVIFIITAPLLTHAVKIDLPQASSQLLPEQPKVISIAIDGAGNLYWNDEIVKKYALQANIYAASRAFPQPELQIRADKETRYQLLAEIMADAQNAGITKLGFLSEAN
jgi:biopolymer transport protein ExbD